MTTTFDAICEHGKLLLPRPLSLPEKPRVRVTIESDTERGRWLKLSEEALAKTGIMTTTTSSMNCSGNDVVLLPIPFTDLTSRKVHPVIVIGKKEMDLFLAPISSVLANVDFRLSE